MVALWSVVQSKNEHGDQQTWIPGVSSGVTLDEFLRLAQYQYSVSTELCQC